MRQEVPEPWASQMVRVGLTDRDRPSIRALARAAQTATKSNRPSVEAVRRMLHGIVASEPETIAAVAEALRLDVRTVSSWAGTARSVVEPYRPPAEADLLTPKQRKAVDQIIRAMTDREESSNDTASTTKAGRAGAKVSKLPTPPTMEEIESGQAAAHRTRRHRREDRQT